MDEKKPTEHGAARLDIALTKSPTNQIARTKQDRAELTVVLARACAAQKAYGRTPAMLAEMVEGWLWAMPPEYSIADIASAIREYILTHSDIPAPADIIAILDPPEPELSAVMYREIKERAKSVFIGRAERDYLAAFEAQEMAKVSHG